MISYSLHHLIRENTVIGIFLLIGSIILLVSTYFEIKGIDNDLTLQIFALSFTISLIITCYYLGIRGILFVFPLISSYFYAYNYKNALLLSCIASVLCLLASLNTMDPTTVARISIGIALTIYFNASFSVLVNRQKFDLEKDLMEDYLTGLLNRRSFSLWLNKEIPSARRTQRILALLYIDLDDFKRINDNYGHDTGDNVLKEVSSRMQLTTRSSDMLFTIGGSFSVARLAGDEFCLVISDIGSISDIKIVIQRLLDALSKPFCCSNITLNVNASIGVAILGKDGSTTEELMKSADSAMYQAKKDGKKRYQFFNEKIAAQISEYASIEKGLQLALAKNEFYLVCMPIFFGDSLKIAGVEVLIRCNSDSLADFGPDKFIPVAEKSGLIYDIDLWVIKTTLQHLIELRQKVNIDNLFFCINISAKELLCTDIAEQIDNLLKTYEVPPEQIELEITETSLIDDIEKSVATLNKLKKIGVRLSLDDFGTGYTAFGQLSSYPIDTLKIDRSFVNDIESQEEKKKSMVDIILSLAELYDVTIIAEGVESKYQLDYLKKLNCQFIQGYYLSKPISWSELEKELI